MEQVTDPQALRQAAIALGLDPDAASDQYLAAQKQKAERQLAVLESLGGTLAKRRDEFVRGRQQSGVELRWMRDLAQYYGRDEAFGFDNVVGTAMRRDANVRDDRGATRSRVNVNITGSKTDAGAARLQELLYPTDDKNWGIQPTPVPKMASMAKDHRPAMQNGQPVVGADGQPLKVSDIARQQNEQAKERSEAMEREINDQLTECQFNAQGRRAIWYAAVFGTGIMKGPVIVNKTRRAWIKAGDKWVRQSVSDFSPSSVARDPRHIYPDPTCGNDPQNGQGIFDRDYITKKQIRGLLDDPTYSREQLIRVLQEKARKTPFAVDVETLRDRTWLATNGDLYEIWEYYGDFTARELREAGLGESTSPGDPPLISPEVDDEESVSAIAIMINDIVVKVVPNPLSSGDFPFDFFNWKRDEDSVWGFGIPFQMQVQQEVTTAAWRLVMDQAILAAGPQIVVKRSLIEPANKRWEITPRKFWNAKEELDDVRKAFTVVEFNSRVAESVQLIDVASKLVDIEVALPQLMQGEQGTAPDTVGVAAMLMNNANTFLKRIVKQHDDQLTTPHIRRYYDFNMEYSDKEEIKGDYQVDARGSSTLVVRDQRNQSAMQFAATFVSHPKLGPYIKEDQLIKQVADAVYLPHVVKTKAEVEEELAKQQPAEDPRVTVEKMRGETARALATLNSQTVIEKVSREIMADLQKAGLVKEQDAEKIKAIIAKTVIEERGSDSRFNAELAAKAAFGSGI